MTGARGQTVRIVAEWALWGKEEQDSRDYHLLECSTGAIDQRAFAEQLARYSPGTLDELPQVSVTWIKDAQAGGHGSHLAVVIRETAAHDPDHAPVRGRRDAFGREIVFARYFCMPYEDLARHSIGLEAMYNAVSGFMLPVPDGQPIPVEVGTGAVQVPPANRKLAEVVAAELLTTRPVCLTGGQRWSAVQRLRFLDEVMSLLPYGMRNQLSASTWVNSGFKTHRFRLFFASAGRTSGAEVQLYGRPNDDLARAAPSDIVINVSQAPDSVTTRDKEALLYLDWVRRASPQNIAKLGLQREPVHLVSKGEIGKAVHGLPSARDISIPAMLAEIDSALRDGDVGYLRECAGNLSRVLAYPDAGVDRKRSRDYIRAHDLMRGSDLPDDVQGDVFDALLGAAVDTPLTYQGYCEVEYCANGKPHPLLLRAMGNLGKVDAIPLILIGDKLKYSDEQMNHLLRNRGVKPNVPLRSLAAGMSRREQPIRAEHGHTVLDVGLTYMLGLDHPANSRAALQELSYLAPVMAQIYEAESDQVNMVRFIISRAHRRRSLWWPVIAWRILAPGTQPSPVLYAAVRSMTLWKRSADKAYLQATTPAVRRSQLWRLPRQRMPGEPGLLFGRQSPRGGDRREAAARRAVQYEGAYWPARVSTGKAVLVLLGLVVVVVVAVLVHTLIGSLRAAPAYAPPAPPSASSSSQVPRAPGTVP